MRKRTKTIFIFLLLGILFFLSKNTNDFVIKNAVSNFGTKQVSAASCTTVNDVDYCCGSLDSAMTGFSRLAATYCDTSSSSYDSNRCRTYSGRFHALARFNCVTCKDQGSSYNSNTYTQVSASSGGCKMGSYKGACGDGYDSHNNYSLGNVIAYSGGHPIVEFNIGGQIAFCTQPSVWYSRCGYYSTGTTTYDLDDYEAQVAYAFAHSSQSQSAYIGAQSMIWGTGWDSEIASNMPENSSSTNKRHVAFNNHDLVLNLGESATISDNNGTLGSYSGKYNVSGTSGLGVNRSGNNLTLTQDNIYPLVKTVSATVTGNNPEASGGGGSITVNTYSSGTSQDFISFSEATLGSITYDYYFGDSATVRLATGSIQINKIDSFNDPVLAGTTFNVWYAKEDPNGTITDADGNKYSIHSNFQTETDYNNGVALSTFTTDENGTVLINNLPTGGHFSDGTPVGTYIVKEASTPGAYGLNNNYYVVKVEAGKTSTITIRNNNTLQTGSLVVNKYDNYGRNIEAGTTFKVWYATTDCAGAAETGTLNGTTYCKHTPFVNLRDKAAGLTQSIYTINDEGFLLINNELPIGGQLSDHTPKGIYIVQEDVPSPAYERNATLFVVDARIDGGMTPGVVNVENNNHHENLTIVKTDDFDRPAYAGIKFQIWYAKENGLDENGEMTYVKYEPFQTVDDYHNGVSISTFETDNDGLVKILNTLPQGGKFPNTDIEIGNYIISEVNDLGENGKYYVYNSNDYAVSLEHGTDTTITIVNDTIKTNFTVFKHDEWNRAIEAGTEFKIWYAEQNMNGTATADDGTKWSKKAPFVTLEDYRNGVAQSVFTVDELGNIDTGEVVPVGGQFADHAPVGTYIIQEANPSDAYELNDKEFVVKAYDLNDPAYDNHIDVENENVKGELIVHKLDEWGRLTTPDIEFTISYAMEKVDEETGETTWVDYAPFISAADFKNGLTEPTVFTTGADGVLTITDILPVGGTIPGTWEVDENGTPDYSTGVKIGNYILHEVGTTNAYVINEEGQFVSIVGHDTTEMDIYDKTRTVSFTTYKQDAEENYRKINGAEFTLYDVSDVVDTKMNYDTKEACEYHNGIWDETDGCNYKTENLWLIKVGTNVDLYTLLKAENQALVDEIGNRPIKFELEQFSLGKVDIYGALETLKVGNLNVKVLGGSWNLWASDGDAVVYDDENFNPYDLKFYVDEEGKKELNVESVAITSPIPDFTVPGDYTISYKVTARNHVIYEFDRNIKVEKDTRHLCLDTGLTDDEGKKIYKWLDTNAVCTEEDAIAVIPSHTNKISPITSTNIPETDEDWENKELYTLELKLLKNDDEIITNTIESWTVLPIFQGLTGHNYVQNVDYDNHNLYKDNEVFILYEDQDLTIPSRIFEDKTEMGVIDIDDERWKNYEDSIYYNKNNCNETGYSTWNNELNTCEITDEAAYCAADLGTWTETDTGTVDEEGNPVVTGSCSYSEERMCLKQNAKWELASDGVTYTCVQKTANEKKCEASENGTYDPSTDTCTIPESTPITTYYYQGPDHEIRSVTLNDTEDGKLNIPNLKHSRTLLACETALPEGYDFGDSNTCHFVETYSYAENEIEHETTLENLLRRVDVAVYKTNGDNRIKLNGAVFDVYETFEEGEDFNEITHTKETLNLGTLSDGTEYYKTMLGVSDKYGSCEAYSLLPDVQRTILLDFNGNPIDNTPTYSIGTDDALYGVNNPLTYYLYQKDSKGNYYLVDITNLEEYQNDTFSIKEYNDAHEGKELYYKNEIHGYCHKVYNPDTVTRKYLGRYVSGGIYETYVLDASGNIKLLNDVKGNEIATYDKFPVAEVEVSYDPDFANIYKTVKLSNGVMELSGLSDGVYYTRLKRPLKEDFIPTVVDPATGEETVVTPTESDYVPYDELDPQYQVVNKYFVSQGMVYLPQIKYGHNLLVVEVKAPSGYYFDDPNMEIYPNAPYGIDVMENYRANNVIVIRTGVNDLISWDNGRACKAK